MLIGFMIMTQTNMSVYPQLTNWPKRKKMTTATYQALTEQEKTQGVDIWHSLGRTDPRETDEAILKRLVENHFRYTGSFGARDLVSNWESARGKFIKIMPVDYKRALGEMWRAANPQPKAA
jgi:glutamate synthase (NADPH/NADH) large chain